MVVWVFSSFHFLIERERVALYWQEASEIWPDIYVSNSHSNQTTFGCTHVRHMFRDFFPPQNRRKKKKYEKRKKMKTLNNPWGRLYSIHLHLLSFPKSQLMIFSRSCCVQLKTRNKKRLALSSSMSTSRESQQSATFIYTCTNNKQIKFSKK